MRTCHIWNATCDIKNVHMHIINVHVCTLIICNIHIIYIARCILYIACAHSKYGTLDFENGTCEFLNVMLHSRWHQWCHPIFYMVPEMARAIQLEISGSNTEYRIHPSRAPRGSAREPDHNTRSVLSEVYKYENDIRRGGCVSSGVVRQPNWWFASGV